MILRFFPLFFLFSLFFLFPLEISCYSPAEQFGASYYSILSVSPNASPIEIKRSFRALALKFHPDKRNFPSDSPELAIFQSKGFDIDQYFLLLSTAYEILSDNDKRLEYDEFLRYGFLDWDARGIQYARMERAAIKVYEEGTWELLIVVIVTLICFIVPLINWAWGVWKARERKKLAKVEFSRQMATARATKGEEINKNKPIRNKKQKEEEEEEEENATVDGVVDESSDDEEGESRRARRQKQKKLKAALKTLKTTNEENPPLSEENATALQKFMPLQDLEPILSDAAALWENGDFSAAREKIEEAIKSISEQIEEEKEEIRQKEEQKKKRQAEKEKEKDPLPVKAAAVPWSAAELSALARGTAKFPPGTVERWARICHLINAQCHGNRSEKEVTTKAREAEFAPLLGRKFDGTRPTKENEAAETKSSATTATPAVVDSATVSASSTISSANSPVSSPPLVWDSIAQQQFEAALKEFPRTVERRWEKIAEKIPGMNEKQCKERFEIIKQSILKERAKLEKNSTSGAPAASGEKE